jgi:hypothetical protein
MKCIQWTTLNSFNKTTRHTGWKSDTVWNNAKVLWTSDNPICKMWFWIEIIETY